MGKILRVHNRARKTTLVTEGAIASNVWARFWGLMGKRRLPEGYGLLLQNESAIHTFGMRLAIDVVYLDARENVLHTTAAMPPSRVGPLVRGARNVLELPIGTLARTNTQSGDHLELEVV
jgi:uncharacterized membrane protein (UPF0127 family)